MKIEFFKGKDKQWYWRAVAKNGQVVAVGGEGYTRRNTCKRGYDRFLMQAWARELAEGQPTLDLLHRALV